MGEPEHKPRGVVAVLTDEKGTVMATASSFEHGGSAGVSQEEAQTWRAKERVAVDFIRGATHPALADAILRGHMRPVEIIHQVVYRQGWKINIIPIGYKEKSDA